MVSAPTVECIEPGCGIRVLESQYRNGSRRCPEHARENAQRRHARWTLTCSDCGNPREYRPSQFRNSRERGQHPEAVVDESTGRGTYTCGPCKQTAIAKASPVGQRIAYLRKKGGRRLAKRAAEVRAQMTDEERQAGIDNAAATNRGRIPTAEERRRRSWSHIAPRPKGRFGLCRVCGLLAYSEESERAETHRDCLNSWRRGRHFAFGERPYPPKPRGNRPSDEQLADTFEIAVRHLLKGEPIGDREGAGLAAEFDLENRSVLLRIDSLIERLPDDGRGGKRLTLWGDALRKAYAQRP